MLRTATPAIAASAQVPAIEVGSAIVGLSIGQGAVGVVRNPTSAGADASPHDDDVSPEAASDRTGLAPMEPRHDMFPVPTSKVARSPSPNPTTTDRDDRRVRADGEQSSLARSQRLAPSRLNQVHLPIDVEDVPPRRR